MNPVQVIFNSHTPHFVCLHGTPHLYLQVAEALVKALNSWISGSHCACSISNSKCFGENKITNDSYRNIIAWVNSFSGSMEKHKLCSGHLHYSFSLQDMIEENVIPQSLQMSISFTRVGTNTGTILNLQNSVVDLLNFGWTTVVEVKTQQQQIHAKGFMLRKRSSSLHNFLSSSKLLHFFKFLVNLIPSSTRNGIFSFEDIAAQ